MPLLAPAALYRPDALARAAGRRAALLAQPILRAADAVCRNWAARRVLREMQSWPDGRLRDIGLSRAELAAAVLGTRRRFRWVPESEATALEPSRFGH